MVLAFEMFCLNSISLCRGLSWVHRHWSHWNLHSNVATLRGLNSSYKHKTHLNLSGKRPLHIHGSHWSKGNSYNNSYFVLVIHMFQVSVVSWVFQPCFMPTNCSMNHPSNYRRGCLFYSSINKLSLFLREGGREAYSSCW